MHDLKKLSDKFNTASLKYCEHNNIIKTDTWVLLKLQEEIGELCQAYLMQTGQARDKGFSHIELKEMLASEAADALGMLMTFIAMQNIDIENHIEKKWKFNPRVH